MATNEQRKMWRPDNWKYIEAIDDIFHKYHPDNAREAVEIAYEAGADAMLEALRAKGVQVFPLSYQLNFEGQPIVPPNQSGTLVFISSDNEDNDRQT